MAKNKTSKDKEYIELGKKLQSFYDSGYVNRKQVLYFTLVKGMAHGFGIVIGGTIVLGIVLWVLGLFEEVPLIGQFVESLNSTIKSNP